MHVTRLLREHAKLRSLGAELAGLVSCPTPCDLDALAKKRWELARMVHQHLAYEDRQIFQRLLADPRQEIQTVAHRGRRGIEQLHALYAVHVKQWTPHDVTSRWPLFQLAVRNLLVRMSIRLDREEHDLFPLVENEPELSPSWQPGARNWAGDGVAMQPLLTAGTIASQRLPAAVRDTITGARSLWV